MNKLKLSTLKAGDVIAWDDISSRWLFVRTATVDRVTGRNIWTSDGNTLWGPDLHSLRFASEQDILDSR